MTKYRHDQDHMFTDTVNDAGEPLDLSDGPAPWPTCEACNGPLDLGGLGSATPVCFPCVQARARAAMDHRCHCNAGQRRPSEIHRAYSRTWISCLRCLGTIAQLT